MRRFSLPLLMVLTLFGCAPSLKGPAAPIAREELDAGFGLDVASARAAVVAFLDAYANASRDRGAALARLVGSAKLADWAHWLTVQNREFEGTISGSVDLHSVDFLASVPVQSTIGTALDLSASVTFSFDPVNGRSFQRRRILDGPVTLVRAATADWRVLDLTRDGLSMNDGIEIFPHEDQTVREITVRIDSLFQFTPSWQFNVILENHSGGDIVLDPSGAALYLRQKGGGFARTQAIVTSSIARVPSGQTEEGLIALPMQDSARDRFLSIPYRTASGKLAAFDFRLGGLVTAVPAPPTDGATAEPTSS